VTYFESNVFRTIIFLLKKLIQSLIGNKTIHKGTISLLSRFGEVLGVTHFCIRSARTLKKVLALFLFSVFLPRGKRWRKPLLRAALSDPALSLSMQPLASTTRERAYGLRS
jgi:hypothetical protein